MANEDILFGSVGSLLFCHILFYYIPRISVAFSLAIGRFYWRSLLQNSANISKYLNPFYRMILIKSPWVAILISLTQTQFISVYWGSFLIIVIWILRTSENHSWTRTQNKILLLKRQTSISTDFESSSIYKFNKSKKFNEIISHLSLNFFQSQSDVSSSQYQLYLIVLALILANKIGHTGPLSWVIIALSTALQLTFSQFISQKKILIKFIFTFFSFVSMYILELQLSINNANTLRFTQILCSLCMFWSFKGVLQLNSRRKIAMLDELNLRTYGRRPSPFLIVMKYKEALAAMTLEQLLALAVHFELLLATLLLMNSHSTI